MQVCIIIVCLCVYAIHYTSPGDSHLDTSFSPKHKTGGGDRYRSPARRALNMHSPQHSPYQPLGSSQNHSFMSTGELVYPDKVDPPPIKILASSVISVSNTTTAITSEMSTYTDENIAALHEAKHIVPSSSNSKAEEASQAPPSNQSLPPVPNRLVSSRSTERIYEMLKQHDMEKKKMQAGEDRSEPLSSTPAGKTTQSGSGHMFTVGQRSSSYESGLSAVSLPEGTFQGEARHKDGSPLSIIFQVCVHNSVKMIHRMLS